VRATYQTKYRIGGPAQHRINAPITVLKARGDEPSFIENSGGHFVEPPVVSSLHADHYSLLKEPGLQELLQAVRHALGA
jgi:hypothetical protein